MRTSHLTESSKLAELEFSYANLNYLDAVSIFPSIAGFRNQVLVRPGGGTIVRAQCGAKTSRLTTRIEPEKKSTMLGHVDPG
jgi:hypothetical protein